MSRVTWAPWVLYRDPVDEVNEACAQLRFAEGLRRRWAGARAEACVQEAAGLAWLEGARVDVADLRDATMEPAVHRDGPLAQALGIWRAAWRLAAALPDLNGPARPAVAAGAAGVLAGINRDVCSALVVGGAAEAADVGVPRDPALARSALAVTSDDDAVRAAAAVLETVVGERLFAHGNVATGFLFAKWLLTIRGVEPTGVCVLATVAASDPGRLASLSASARLVRNQDRGDAEGSWRAFVEDSLVEGCAQGQKIARATLAGRVPESMQG